MDIDKKIKIAKIITKTSLLALMTSGVVLVHGLASNPFREAQPPQLASMLKEAGIHTSADYENLQSSKLDLLYKQLCDEDISIDEFNEGYKTLHSTSHLEEYALNSNNPQIQNIINKYEVASEQYSQDKSEHTSRTNKKIAGFVANSVISLTGCTIWEHLERKKRESTSNSASNLDNIEDDNEMTN